MKKYGWVKDEKDTRDFKYKVHRHFLKEVKPNLPKKIDLRHTMPPVLDQGELGSCHDVSTDILTSQGWVPFTELTLDHKLASVDPETKTLIYEYPTRVIKLPYNGLMIRGESNAIDFLVTPDHSMLVRKWDETTRTLKDTFELVKAKDIGWYAGLMPGVDYLGTHPIGTYTLPGIEHTQCCQRENKTIPMDIWMMFLGLYLAEGTIIVHNKKKASYKIQIAASKEREKSFARYVLNGMGQHFLELKDRFTFHNKQLYLAMCDLGLKGIKAHEKFVPEFVFQQSGEMIKNFLLGHFMGDGSEQKGIKTHYTSSEKLINDLQRLIFLSGSLSGRSTRDPRNSVTKDGREIHGKYPEYSVRVWQRESSSICRKDHITQEFYDGFVYCAEVPTYHTLVTRRNGKILISGNCTANAISGALGFLRYTDPSLEDWSPSRLFIYFHERVEEDSVEIDQGAQIRTGIKIISTLGAPPEDLWPYDITKWKSDPGIYIDNEAHKYLATTYYRINWSNLEEVKGCLASGYPIVFGFMVFPNLDEVGSDGILTMPPRNTMPDGGHAVLLCGYNDDKKLFLVRNSWGPDWGEGGYFWMPYEYVTSPELSDDFWTIRCTL